MFSHLEVLGRVVQHDRNVVAEAQTPVEEQTRKAARALVEFAEFGHMTAIRHDDCGRIAAAILRSCDPHVCRPSSRRVRAIDAASGWAEISLCWAPNPGGEYKAPG